MARSVRLGAFSSIRELARGLGKIGALAAGTLALGAASVGCAPGNPGLTVSYQLAPNDTCVFDPSATLTVSSPTMDLDPLTPAILSNLGPAESLPLYSAQFVTLNSLINRFSTVYPVMADPNTITLTAAEIELLNAQGRRVPSGFYRTRANGVIGSAVGDQPGRGLATVDVIPSTVADALAIEYADRLEGDGLLTARIVMIGTTQGGSEIRSSPYILPIQLCYGCLYADHALAPGESPGCTPGRDFVYNVAGFTRTPACVVSEDCVSGLCVLGHCARDPV